MTGVVIQQSVLVNGIPCYICDLRPGFEMGHSVTDENDESSGGYGPPENITAILLDDLEANCGTCPALKEHTDQKATTILHYVWSRDQWGV